MGFSFGPKILRIHVSKRSTGISSGIGWFSVSGYSRRGASGGRSSGNGGSEYEPPTPAEIADAKRNHVENLQRKGWLLLEGKDAPIQRGTSSFVMCRDMKSPKIAPAVTWTILFAPAGLYYLWRFLKVKSGDAIQYRQFWIDGALRLHWLYWQPKSVNPQLRLVSSLPDARKELDMAVEQLFGTHTVNSRTNTKVVMASRANPSNLVTLEIGSSGQIRKTYSKT